MVFAAALASVAGCYEYAPTRAEGAAPGAEVRLTLTDAGSVDLASQLGPRVEAVDGLLERAAGAAGDTIVLRARRTVQRNGREADWQGERIVVPARAVASVRERRLSRSRTALAAVAVVGGAIGAVILGRKGGYGGGSPPGSPPGTQ